ncbi:MAG TPA: rhodanese-like domain-containing protein [Bdellovibrionota bacterium]|jgi:rhodanese-related sulfurtransferase|nr:rhodanese-like domain-containing protein [Bdellovibrionota bacterium]
MKTHKPKAVIDPEKAQKFFENKVKFTLGPTDLKHRIDDGQAPKLFDVRAAKDFEKGHIPGAVSLPDSKWGSYDQLSKSEVNIFYCYTPYCHLAAKAAAHFAAEGFPVMELDGGIQAWREYGFHVTGLEDGQEHGLKGRPEAEPGDQRVPA